MIVTLELSKEEVQTLRPLADAAGVDLETVLHQMIALLPPVASEKPQGFHEDSAEQKIEEDAERRREQEEMQANIKRWHAEKEAN